MTSANFKDNTSLYQSQKCYPLGDPGLQIYLMWMVYTSHPFENALTI